MNTVTISPIETYYKGCRFRSRLEARWAVFFDNVGVEWQYEPEGFLLDGNVKYLPDFYLPEMNAWIEIKGTMSEYDENKIKKFVDAGNTIYILGSIPPEGYDIFFFYDHCEKYPEYSWNLWDWPYVPCVCPTCGKFGIQFDGRGERICRHDAGDKGYSYDADVLVEAYRAARCARFEFGETPE